MQHVIASVAKQSHNQGISQLEIASSLRSPVTAPASSKAPAFGALPPAWAQASLSTGSRSHLLHAVVAMTT